MKTKLRLKTGLALLMTIVMMFSIVSPVMAAADFSVNTSLFGSNTKLTAKTDYNIAPGVTETHLITHNKDGSNQNKSYALKVDLNDPTTGIIASFENYEYRQGTPTDQTMQTVRDQAVAAEHKLGIDVVAGTNGDFFNLSTGAPTGTLVMNGTLCNLNNSWPYFGITKDGTPVIGRGNPDTANLKECIGGPSVIVENGALTSEALTAGYGIEQLPRTAVGYTANNEVILLVADGRQAPESCGMTFKELGEAMLALGCTNALALDGGGSATMISQHEGSDEMLCRNSPSDGSERTVSTALLVTSSALPDGVFHHATLSPNNELYTPGSSVQFTATGVDSSGSAAELPAGEFALADAAAGTIDGATGVYTANPDFTGEVTVNYVVGGEVKGSTKIQIQKPDEITFRNDEISLGFEAQTDLGLQVKYQSREMNFKDGDIVWTMQYENMGSFTGNMFTSSDSASVTGTITATSAYDETVSGTMTAIIGKLPKVIWDFEDADAYKFAYAQCDPSGGSIVAYGSDYVAGETTFLNLNYGRGSVMQSEIIDADTGMVRMGTHALKFSYDFTSATSQTTTEGACFGAVTATESTEGNPTAIGMWMYAPEGTPNFWVRMRLKDGNGTVQTVNFTQNYTASTNTGGIDWTGWKYLEADITHLPAPYSFIAGETIRIMILANSSGHYTYTGANQVKPVAAADCKGYVYIDNVQFVYGANTDDVDNPVIDKIEVGDATGSNMTDIGADTVVNANDICIQTSFHDVQNKYTTDINFDACRIYVDGKDVTKEAFVLPGDFTIKYYPTLANGTHSVKVVIRDGFNNEVSETRYFTVSGEQADLPTVTVTPASDSCTLNEEFSLNVSSNASSAITSVTTQIRFDKDIVKSANDISVNFAAGFTGNYAYDASTGVLTLTINAVPTRAARSAFAPLATVTAKVPADVAPGKSFTFRVLEGTIDFNDAEIKTTTFSTGDVTTPIYGAYNISADTTIVGNGTYINVKNADGTPAANVNVYNDADDSLIGTTDANGRLRYVGFSGSAQYFTIYANSGDKYSFTYTAQSYVPAGDSAGTPYNVILNAKNDTAVTVSWLANPLAVADKAYAEYATKADYDANGADAFVKAEGTNKLITLSGSTHAEENYAVAVGNATVSGLKENTEYVYRVGDGAVWSDVKSFKTSVANANTSFFVLGDIQARDTSMVQDLLNATAADGVDYAFGIQTGDAVESAAVYTDWDDILKVFSSEAIADVPMVHVLGNHEYMGDYEGVASNSIFAQPEENYYSVEYGNVYVATFKYADNSAASKQAAIDWLKEDAAKSDATWKIVTVHTPVYNTNILDAETFYRENLTPVAEELGIDFVFAGHDHSYARTEPMVQGQVDENGVVYFISGSSGEKSYGVTVDPAFNFVKATNEYTSIYLSVTATDSSITVTAYDVEGTSKEVFDTYTKTITTDCTKDGHKFTYADGWLVCDVCDYKQAATGYTGAATNAAGLPMQFVNGEALKNVWVEINGGVYYLGADGIALTGTQKIGNYEYPFDAAGKLTKFAIVLDDGTLQTNSWYGNQRLGADGMFLTGVQTIGEKTYTFDAQGNFVKGALVKEGNYTHYYIAGEIQRNWHMIDGYWHYFDRQTGYGMATADNADKVSGDIDRTDGKYTIENYDGSYLLFTFDKDGRLTKGAWLKTDAGWVYYWGNNERYTGWHYIDGEIYYFGTDYYMVTGEQTIGEKTYTFASSGALQLKEENFEIDGTFYYYDANGKIVKDHIANHAYVKSVLEAKAPKCEETGLTAGEKCANCDFVLVRQKTVDALGHDYVAVVTDATCTDKGFTTYTCSVCGDSYIDNYTDALGHDGEWVVVKEATVGVDGLKQLVCKVCGEVLDEEEIPALAEPSTDDDEPTVKLGDINGDGEITAADARLILRMSAKLDNVTDPAVLAAADLNKDGVVTAADARIALRIAAKLESIEDYL